MKRLKRSDFMPEDLLIEILQRLPIKPLVRFTTVCKSWHDLIISSGFISTHLSRTDTPKKTHQILFGKSTKKDNCMFSYDDRLCDDSLSKIEFPFNFYDLSYSLVGSANGLLCIRDNGCLLDPVIIFWNPSIQKSLCIHPPNLDAVTPSWRFMQQFGFGYDHVNSDYKLVRIMPYGKSDFTPGVDLFALSTGKWEDISHLARGYCIFGSCVCVNGVFHWLGYVEGGKYSIVSFELVHNVFSLMMLPEDTHNHVIEPFKVTKAIVVYRGFLAMFIFEHDSETTSKLCTWVMKSYGDVESWTHLYNIDLGEPFKLLVGIGMNSNVLLLDNNQCLVSLDFKESNYEKLERNCCVRSVKWSYVQVVPVTESLVLLDQGHECCDDATFLRMIIDICASERLMCVQG